MTSQSNFNQTPRLAMWLLTLFALDDAAEHILGDLLEEYTRLGSKSGVPYARRWYWRQTLRTIFQLAVLGFRTAPWLTTAAIAGGFLLRKLAARWVEPPIFAVLEKYHVYQHHFSTYMFFASTGIDIGHLITFLFVGFIVAFVAKGREMAATMALGLIFVAMIVVALAAEVMLMGRGIALDRQLWYFADSMAIVIAGAIIRTHRLRMATRHTIMM